MTVYKLSIKWNLYYFIP